MKKIIALSFAFLLTGLSYGQLKEALMKKANEKLTKGKESNSSNTSTNSSSTPTDTKTTNDQSTSVKGDSTATKTDAKSSGNGMFSMGGGKEIQPTYTFHQNVLMDMKSYDKKGNLEQKKSSTSRFYYSKNPYHAVESMDKDGKSVGFGIMEYEKSQMVNLIDNGSSKMAMVVKINKEKVNEKAAEENKGVTISKSGRTKKICGYTCEEWVSTDEKGRKSEMWMSSEVAINTTAAYAMFGGQQGQNMPKMTGDPSKYPSGYMMEITTYETNGEKFTMTAIEVNLNAEKVIDTKGYQVF